MEQSKQPAKRLSDMIEDRLVEMILGGDFPPGAALPLERDLAAGLGVGRPTLREALQRLERDGWLSVRKGQPTRVNDYWRDGNLNIMAALARHHAKAPALFIDYLLELRVALTPAYVRQAVEADAARVVAMLVEHDQLADDPASFADFDWRLQKNLARAAANPVYALMLNSFDTAYLPLATEYFGGAANRRASARFYRRLMEAAMARDGALAAEVARAAMTAAMENWRADRAALDRAAGEELS